MSARRSAKRWRSSGSNSRHPCIKGLQAALLTRQWRFFDQWNLSPRDKVSSAAQQFIDKTLFQWKLETLTDGAMRYKSRDSVYTRAEVEDARLVLKNNNGIIFLTERFLEMYPDAVFIGLIRDPIPLFESHKRNRTPVSATAPKFAAFYKSIVHQMQADAARFDRYHILHFEDIFRAPISAVHQVYRLAGLDISKVSQLRLKAKPHMHADGTHTTSLQAGSHHWFPFEQIPQILEPNVNQFQASQLRPQDEESVRFLTSGIRAELGYTG